VNILLESRVRENRLPGSTRGFKLIINLEIYYMTFSNLFQTILTSNKEDSRKSAREVRKLLYSSTDYNGRYDEIENAINNAPKEYENILEDWRQENFVMAVSVMYFLHNKENQPDFLFPWIFSLIQHKNGNIRNAGRRMLEIELGPLTVHIRCPEYKQSKSKSERSDFILLNLFINLNSLLVATSKPAYKKYKYIDSLPSSPYKTIQMILGIMEEDCGKEYIKNLENLSKLQ